VQGYDVIRKSATKNTNPQAPIASPTPIQQIDAQNTSQSPPNHGSRATKAQHSRNR
jgi:hypothetical protein